MFKILTHILRIAALLFVGGMIYVQIPELTYDFGAKVPKVISDPAELIADNFPKTTFISLKGRPDFDKAFVYKRYGLSYTYFNIKPYGMQLVVRTYEEVTDEWENINMFLGKLRPFNRQPFHYKIKDIYQEKFNTEVPENAFFLALDDVPKISGWQVGAIIFASLLWIVMFYMFYLYNWKEVPR
jgi:hypothetical protein